MLKQVHDIIDFFNNISQHSTLSEKDKAEIKLHFEHIVNTFGEDELDYLVYPCSGYDASGILFAQNAKTAILIDMKDAGDFKIKYPEKITPSILAAYNDYASQFGYEQENFSSIVSLNADNRIWPALIGKLLRLANVQIQSITPVTITDEGCLVPLDEIAPKVRHFKMEYTFSGVSKTLIYLQHEFGSPELAFNVFCDNIPKTFGPKGRVLLKAISSAIRTSSDFYTNIAQLPAEFISDKDNPLQPPLGFNAHNEIDITGITAFSEKMGNASELVCFCHDNRMYKIKGPLLYKIDQSKADDKTKDNTSHAVQNDFKCLCLSDEESQSARVQFNQLLGQNLRKEAFFRNSQDSVNSYSVLKSTAENLEFCEMLVKESIIPDYRDCKPLGHNYIQISECSISKLDKFFKNKVPTNGTQRPVIHSPSGQVLNRGGDDQNNSLDNNLSYSKIPNNNPAQKTTY